jgi:AcrR family transcriptional regulator
MRKKIDINIIYAAALKHFSNYGYKKTTLEDIASELLMTNSSMYLYAKSKRELYEESVAFAMRKWQNRVKAAIADIEDPREQLMVLCQKAVAYLSEDAEFCRVLQKDPEIFPMFPSVDPYEEINSDSLLMLSQTIKRGIDAGVFRPVNPDSAAEVLFSIYKVFIIQSYVKTENDYIGEMFSQTLQMITKGIFVPEPGEVKDITL